MRKVYLICFTAISSYFILSFINFWNLSLLYIFLQIALVPSFAHDILENLAFILFFRNNLTNWLDKQLSGKISELDSSYLSSFEKVIKFKGHYSWFGSMSMTSNYFDNNFQPILLLILLIAKLFVIKFLFSKINILEKLFGRINSNILFHIFAAEFMCLSPFMLISTL